MKEYYMPLVGGDYLVVLEDRSASKFRVYGWHNLKGIFDADPRITSIPNDTFKMEVLGTDEKHCMVTFKKVAEIPDYWAARIERLKNEI